MSLDWQEMLKTAQQRSGLQDWGDNNFQPRFRTLVNALNTEATLSIRGEALTRAFLLQRLQQRLALFDDRKKYPAISSQEIDRPIFVTGMPRAGTTYLHTLLAAGPAAIAPAFWQLLAPSPPANAPDIDHAPALAGIKAFLTDQGWFGPAMMRVHHFDAELPEECPFAFEFSFLSTDFTGWWNIPSYMQVFSEGFGPAYEAHRMVLQALQLGVEGRRWVLKAPEHCTHMDALLEAYPDATIVQNHRDPVKVIASVLSTMSASRGLYAEHQEFTRQNSLQFVALYAGAMRYMIAARAKPEFTDRIVDVHYLDLEREPLATVQRIYNHAGMTFDTQARAAIEKGMSARQKHSHGKHRYSLESYGLTEREVRDAFADYTRHFGIEPETAKSG